MGKFDHQYHLITALKANQISLRKVISDKESNAYLSMEEVLFFKWDQKYADEKRNYTVGDHVMVKSSHYASEGIAKRGVVQDRLESMPGSGIVIYTVFLYDHGELEEVSNQNLKSLDREWKSILPPLSVIVTLAGVVPLKRVTNTLGQEDASPVFREGSHTQWPKRTFAMVKEWLMARKLLIEVVHDNDNCTVFGDIRRLPQSNDPTSQEEESEDDLESLIGWMIKNNLAVNNESLWKSQLLMNSYFDTDATTANPNTEYTIKIENNSAKVVPVNVKVESGEGVVKTGTSASVETFPAQTPRNRFHSELVAAKEIFHQVGDQVHWAFIERNSKEYTKIQTTCGYHPWIFYGNHLKFETELKNLEQDLTYCVNTYITGVSKDKRWINYVEIFKNVYEPQMIVAAKDELENKWIRAQILSKTTEGGSGKVIFNLFNVDYGDLAEVGIEDVFPIPRKFVELLPFQAIAFKLDKIQPIDKSKTWSEKEKEKFLDLITPSGLSEELDIKVTSVVEMDQRSQFTPGRYYNAVALLEKKELGSCLVKKGFAIWKNGG